MKKFFTIAFICGMVGTVSYANETATIEFPRRVDNSSTKNVSFSKPVSSDFLNVIKFANQNQETKVVNIIDTTLTSKYLSATDKFTQCNITAAYKEYAAIIDSVESNDFTYLSLAYRFANIGLFSLVEKSLSKIQDKKLWQTQAASIREIYFPKNTLLSEDEIYLAQMYSDIHFNNLAFESVKDLQKKDKLLKKYDYAQYMLASAYYETKEFSKALNALNRALAQNPNNTHYLNLKVRVLCDTKQFAESLKIVDSLVAKKHKAMNYHVTLEVLQQYVLARFYKDDVRSKYHLASYLMLVNDYSRSIKELNQILVKKKKEYKALTLIGDVYYKTADYVKALDYYNRSYKINKKYPQTLIGLGNINFYSANYKSALENYELAQKKDKTNAEVLVNSALTYKMLSQEDRAYELLSKAIELDGSTYKAYYSLSLIFDEKKKEYLNSTVAINPLFVDAWLDLAALAITKKEIPTAQKCLDNAKLLDVNNYKYYYVQGQLYKASENYELALLNFKKANKLNPTFEDAKREINIFNNI